MIPRNSVGRRILSSFPNDENTICSGSVPSGNPENQESLASTVSRFLPFALLRFKTKRPA